MEETKGFCDQHARLSAGVLFCLFLIVGLVCMVSYGWVSLSDRLDTLTRENSMLKEEVLTLRKNTAGMNDRGGLIKREIISSDSRDGNKDVVQRDFGLYEMFSKLTQLNQTINRYHPPAFEVMCPSGYRLNPYTSTCYRFVRSKESWFDAKTHCEVAGETLATFDTVDAASWFRQQQVAGGWNERCWIGGRKFNGVWRWFGTHAHTGEITMSFWGIAEPNYDGSPNCLGTANSYYWDDYPCSSIRAYLCEKQMQ